MTKKMTKRIRNYLNEELSKINYTNNIYQAQDKIDTILSTAHYKVADSAAFYRPITKTFRRETFNIKLIDGETNRDCVLIFSYQLINRKYEINAYVT